LLRLQCAELILVDALFYNENSFKRVREKNAHILVKYKEPEFREVLKGAQFVFGAKDKVTGKVPTADGFDSKRRCSWTIEITQ
jgi:hypothetical protein